MICAACQTPNPDEAPRCSRCASHLAASAAAERAGPGQTVAAPLEGTVLEAGTVAAGAARPAVEPVPDLGPRYEVVRLLGRGGMGAVWLARDRELGRDVAVKLIAAHLAARPSLLDRFKREIQLSSLVTHGNVLRAYDLGEHHAQQFLTMQFIDGDTLAGELRRGPLGVARAEAVFRAICEGLAAAHALGVVHRDLKPQNVMVDRDGKPYLSDFGLATSRGDVEPERPGALVGTPQYMSPEQALGRPADARSDVYAAGLLLYEMLAGMLPFQGTDAYEILAARTRSTPRPIREVAPEVPERLQRILDKCLALDPDARYPSAAELLADVAPQLRPSRRALAVAWAAALLAVCGAGFVTWRLWPAPKPPSVRTVLVADFRNDTGEEVFEGTLEPALGTALEGASFISAYGRPAARRTADRLQLQGTALDEQRARLVAQREGIGVVAAGEIARAGKGYRLVLRAVDAVTGATLAERAEEAPREAVLASVAKLAAAVRKALGDRTPEGVQLQEGETYSAGSLEAAHAYAQANDLAARQGRFDDAARAYEDALRQDPKLGRAYSGLAVLESNRGRHTEAERWFKLALAQTDRMSEREKLRTRGVYYLFVRDAERAIQTYTALVRQYPADNVALANLALAYTFAADFASALEASRKALAIFPKNVPFRNNVGFFATYAGRFDEGVEEQQRVISESPSFSNGHVGLAMALTADGRRDAAVAAWDRLRQIPGGESLAVEGLADLALSEGRLADARTLLEAGAATDLAAKDPDFAGRKLVLLAAAHLEAGQTGPAVHAAERALQASRSDPVLVGAGQVLAGARREKRVLALADELDRRPGAAPRMYAEVLRGEAALARRDAPEAIARFGAAVKRLDHWLAREGLGRAHLAAGSWPAAQEELERCDKRRGEATDLFVDTIPTWRFYPAIKYRLGLVAEQLGTGGAREAYQEFLALRRNDDAPLAKDARRRLAALP